MKSKTLKQFLAERRKSEVQTADAVMKAVGTLAHVKDGAYFGSAVIINITDLEGKVLTDAAINGEMLDALRPHLVEAYRQTLMAKEVHVAYNLRKIQNTINTYDPERPKQPQK